jgi:hypothetical protein
MNVRQIAPYREARARRRRREQNYVFKHLVALAGENVMRALLQAVIQRSEQPLARLPASKWRESAIAAFRENPMPPRREAQVVPLR